jgi:hypothetical protein
MADLSGADLAATLPESQLKVPRGNELFTGFPVGAFHVFTEIHLTATKALWPVGFSPFFARRENT